MQGRTSPSASVVRTPDIPLKEMPQIKHRAAQSCCQAVAETPSVLVLAAMEFVFFPAPRTVPSFGFGTKPVLAAPSSGKLSIGFVYFA